MSVDVALGSLLEDGANCAKAAALYGGCGVFRVVVVGVSAITVRVRGL